MKQLAFTLVQSKLVRQALAAMVPPSALRIVCYHSICDHHPFLPRYLYVSPKTFRRHLELFASEFDVIRPDEVGRTSVRRPLLITFDDGLIDNWDVAVPLLREFGWSATFFIPTLPLVAADDLLWTHKLHVVARDMAIREIAQELGLHNDALVQATSLPALTALVRRYCKYEELRERLNRLVSRVGNAVSGVYMTATHIASLARTGMQIGAHSHTHFWPPQPDALHGEVEGPNAELESITGVPPVSFAYPFGDPDSLAPLASDYVRSRYASCMSTIAGVNYNRGAAILNRICLYEMSPEKVFLKVLYGI